jgi:hypothetical protein
MPAKIALDALEKESHLWDVYKALTDLENNKTNQLKELLKPFKNPALAAAIWRDSEETINMVYTVVEIAGSLPQVTK